MVVSISSEKNLPPCTKVPRDDDVAGERQPVYSTRALAKAIMPRYKGSLKRGRVGLLRQQARAAGATNGEEEVAATADDPVSSRS